MPYMPIFGVIGQAATPNYVWSYYSTESQEPPIDIIVDSEATDEIEALRILNFYINANTYPGSYWSVTDGLGMYWYIFVSVIG